MRIKLTKRVVDAVRLQTRDQFLWDRELRGFGMKVTPTGAKLYVLAYHTKAGRRRRYTLDGAHGSPWTVEKAREEAKRLQGRIVHGADPVAEREHDRKAETVSELATLFIERHLPARKSSTAKEYHRIIDKYILPPLGKLKVSQLDRADIARLHHAMREIPRQANMALAVLSKMMSLAEAWGLRPEGSNPCRYVERYKEQRRERFLSEVELARLGESLRKAESEGHLRFPAKAGKPERTVPINPSAVAGIRLLLFTGARLGEILTLKWEHVDDERGLLALPDSKTGAKRIIVNAPARQVLAGLPRTEGNPYVLPGERRARPGEDPPHFIGVHKPWEAIREHAGIPDVRIHDLRHSFASVGASGGMGLPIIGALLGHTQAATTQRYAHLAADPLKQASESIASRIAEALNGNVPEQANVVPLPKGRRARKGRHA